ncbi:VanW family protein [Nocardioides lianchengensis]|uniref:Vancomycin resistance protein VanW n=1 Tax=Nocardioides lianchengensis TaxID=1045774 RepID=A0A1G6NCX8_9ACTN|nr:VanW family protein [Nocardioides lianchengensis]NYG10733.1 vancomycin resistance protein VanW [Nocardioides lianchengensis]SDC65683.1 vancomycin resistance protein VanW [Nocardioides lianchengensis]
MTALSRRHPWLRPLAVAVHRARRRLAWCRPGTDWARERRTRALAVRAFRHRSLLLRELPGVAPALQHGKVVNLRLAAARLDGVVLQPGQTLSFNRTIGNATRRKGYVDGLRLADGRPAAGVGGGLCQLANLVHWLVLHSPLTVVERSEHSVDPFPDHERVVPWGVGCTIAYNYVDLVVRNDTTTTFQLRAWVGRRHLHGELRTDRLLPHTYVVEARGEEFVRLDGVVHRRNEIWRTVRSRTTNGRVRDELVRRTSARVLYDPDPALVREA